MMPASQYNGSFDLSSNLLRGSNIYNTTAQKSIRNEQKQVVKGNSYDDNSGQIIVPIKTQKAQKVMKLYQDVYNDLQELSRELN